MIDDQRVEHPLDSLRPVVGVEEIEAAAARGHRGLRRPADRARGSSSSSARRARWPPTSVGASVRGSLALERAVARLGARSTGATTSSPPTSSGCFLAVLGHRVVLTPAKLAEARQHGMAAALAAFAEECLRARAAADARARGRAAARAGVHDRAGASRSRSSRAGGSIGLAFGAMHGARRGTGSDIAGSRPYVPGDDPDRIDWASSARLSGARATRRVRRPRVLRRRGAARRRRLDRRPAMSLCPPGMPVARARPRPPRSRVGLIEASVAEARGFVGRLEFGASAGHRRLVRRRRAAAGTSRSSSTPLPERDGRCRTAITRRVSSSSRYHRRAVPAASFVFVALGLPRARRRSRPGSRRSTAAGTSCRSSSRTRLGAELPRRRRRRRAARRLRRPHAARAAPRRASRGAWRARHEARLAGLARRAALARGRAAC